MDLSHKEFVFTDEMIQASIAEEKCNASFQSKVFAIMCILELVLNLDAGILPSALPFIQSTFNLQYDESGILGSLVYFGLSLSCPLSGYLLSRFESKRVLVVLGIWLNLISAAWISIATTKWELYICRLLNGFSKGPIIIYAPGMRLKFMF